MSATDTAPPRSAEILDRIKAVFAAKGFDGASMQDLARAAGMSAGNFYRYFPSKDAIVAAMVERDLEGVMEDFNHILADSDALTAFREVVRQRISANDACEGAIWAEIEASSSRRPDLCAAMERMEQAVIRNLTDIFARIAGLDPAVAAVRFEPQARLIVLLVQGMVKGAAHAGGADSPAHRALGDLVMKVIEGLLADVAAAGASERAGS